MGASFRMSSFIAEAAATQWWSMLQDLVEERFGSDNLSSYQHAWTNSEILECWRLSINLWVKSVAWSEMCLSPEGKKVNIWRAHLLRALYMHLWVWYLAQQYPGNALKVIWHLPNYQNTFMFCLPWGLNQELPASQPRLQQTELLPPN